MAMLRVGDSPETFIYDTFAGSPFYMDKVNFSNKVTLLSFLDINDAWGWLVHMKNLREYFPVATVSIVAVIFDHSGFVNEPVINAKFPDPDLIIEDLKNPAMPVCMDGDTFGSSISAKYLSGFDNTNDPSFHSNASQAFCTYIISERFYITDKWNYNCTTAINQDPISFRRFTAGGVPFDSQNFVITEAYVKERITRLLAYPEVTSIQPVEGFVPELTQVKITLSKPVGSIIDVPTTSELLDISSVTDILNYTFTGGATVAPGSLIFSAVKPVMYENCGLPSSDPDNVGKIENVITLNLVASLTDTHADKSAVITLSNITDTSPTPHPVENGTITYIYDVTPPSISVTTTAGQATKLTSVDYTISGSDASLIKSWAVVIQPASDSAPDPGAVVFTDCTPPVSPFSHSGTLAFSDGEQQYTVYAFLKDVPGIKSSASFNITYDKTAPVVSSFTTVVAPVISPAPISFTINGTDLNGITGWIVTETPVQPSLLTAGWTAVASSSPAVINGTFTPQVSGCRNLYAWIRDAAGNISVFSTHSYCSFIYQKNPWAGLLARDIPSDSGHVPVTDPILYVSLDIITMTIAEPITNFPNYDDRYWHAPDPLIKGTPYYFYLRMKNCTGSNIAAGAVNAYMYYSPSSLFNTPSTWIHNSIMVDGLPGEKANPVTAINAGNAGFEQHAFKWTPDVTAGHYCFIGIVSSNQHPWDPENPLKFETGIEFSQFVANSPNICWKNHNVTDAKKVKNSFSRKDILKNDWEDELPVMIGVTVCNVTKGTVVEIINTKLGINVHHVMDGPEDVVYTEAKMLKGKVATKIKTTVTLPGQNQRFAHGAQIETTAYIGVRSKAIAESGGLAKFGRAEKLARVQSSFKLVEQKGKGLNNADAEGPAGFVRMGSYTTIFKDPEIKKAPVIDLRQVNPVIPRKDAGMIESRKPGTAVRPVKAKTREEIKSKTGKAVKAKLTFKTKPKSKPVVKTIPVVKKTVKLKVNAAAKNQSPVKKKVSTKVGAVIKKTVKPGVKLRVKPVVKKTAVAKTKPAVKKSAIKQNMGAVKKKPVVKIKISAKKQIAKISKPAVKSTVKKTAVKKQVAKSKAKSVKKNITGKSGKK